MTFISALDRGNDASHDRARDDRDARASLGAGDAGFASAGLHFAGGHHEDLHGSTMHGRSPWSGTIYQPEQATVMAKPDAIGRMLPVIDDIRMASAITVCATSLA
jgi:hypothetical protein